MIAFVILKTSYFLIWFGISIAEEYLNFLQILIVFLLVHSAILNYTCFNHLKRFIKIVMWSKYFLTMKILYLRYKIWRQNVTTFGGNRDIMNIWKKYNILLWRTLTELLPEAIHAWLRCLAFSHLKISKLTALLEDLLEVINVP